MNRNISGRLAALTLAQTLLILAALALMVYGQAGWQTLLPFGVAATCALWASLSASRRGIFPVVCAITGAFSLASLEAEFLIAAAFMGIASLLASEAVGRSHAWRRLALGWGFIAVSGWLFVNYKLNHFFGFHCALFTLVALLILCRLLAQPSPLAIHCINSLLLFAVALPVADCFFRRSYVLHPVNPGHRFYSFNAAQRDPSIFAWWWWHFFDEAMALHTRIGQKETDRRLRWRFQPGAQSKFFESTIKINSHGFRGPEFELDKGDAYRIIAIGESTTFGYTMTADGKSWPRVLEELLARRLKTKRPIQVINAGIYGFNIEENVHRVKTRLLALKPNMILSYHGYNYFPTLNPAIPEVRGDPPPAYDSRPLKLLANLEYRLQMAAFKKSRQKARPASENIPNDFMELPYAKKYRELIETTRSHGVRLALANFSMAVNAESPDEVVEFYRGGFEEVRELIQANRVHTKIVRQLIEKNPDLIFVDTQPAMDGEHEKYIDLVHFTQPGRDDMAEIFYEAIAPTVEKEANASPDKGENIVGSSAGSIKSGA